MSVAPRLRHGGIDDVGILEPAVTQYYQPLWTLTGGGCAPIAESAWPEASAIPKGVAWIKDRALGIDPEQHQVSTGNGGTVSYDQLLACPGIQLDWGKIPGMVDAIATPRHRATTPTT